MYIKSHYCSLTRINQVKGRDDVIMTSFTLGLEIHSYLATKAVQYRSKTSSGRCYHLTHLLQDKYLSILVSRLYKTYNTLRTLLFQGQNIRNKTISLNIFYSYPSPFFYPITANVQFPPTVIFLFTFSQI